MRCAQGIARYAGFFAVLAAAACGAEEPAAIVTEPIRHVEEQNTEVVGGLERAAIDYALSIAGPSLSASDELAVLSVRTGAAGMRHVRLQQLHRGVPVLSSEIIVHADETTFLGLNGTITRNLPGLDVTPAVAEAAALEAARRHHAATAAATGAIRYEREQSRLLIMPGEAGGASLVWHHELLVEAQPGVEPGRWHIFVDARSGEVVRAFDGLATLEQASGPGGNGRTPRSWDAQLDVEVGGDGYLMETERIVTYDMENSEGDLPDMPVTSATLDFPDRYVNDAHGFTEVTLDMLRDWYGYESIDGAGFQIVNRVHYGVDYDVAFWDGVHVTFGDSDPSVRYPRPGALDIVAHEMAHGFTEFHSGLIYDGMSGGMNESFSDVLGTLAEFFHEGDGADFKIGEDIYVDINGLHRDMCDPTVTGRNDHVEDFDRETGVHTSSGIANKAFCLSVARLKASDGVSTVEAARRMGEVWVEANASYWTSGTTFVEGCQGTVDAAHALGLSKAQVEGIVDSWADVGVSCADEPLVCDDDGSCELDAGETCFSCPGDCGACADSCNIFKKAKCALGLGDCTDCPGERGCGDGVCDSNETDVTCGEDCGCAAEEGAVCGSVAPYGCYCDADCAASGDCCADIDEC